MLQQATPSSGAGPDTGRVGSVIVLGGGTAGLLSALTVRKNLPGVPVRVIRSPDIGIIGVGEGTTASFPRHLFQNLKLDMLSFYRDAKPTWKLGIRFIWGPRPHFYYVFATEYAVQPSKLSRPVGYYVDDQTTCLGAVSALCDQDKAFMPDAQGRPMFHNHYAFHIENEALANWLEGFCRREGVEITDANIDRVDVGEHGVERLVGHDGAEYTADLYIDASGFRSELLGKALGVPYRSYADGLFCDRAVVGGWARKGEPTRPYTTSETMDAGWCWQIEHEHFINRGYVYASDHITDDAAREELLRKNPRIKDTRVVKFRSGRREWFWEKNVVGLGNAAGFVEPLEATAIQAIIVQVTGVTDMLRDASMRVTPMLRSVYNRFNARMWDDIRDFLAVHYKFNSRLDTPFWRRCREETPLGEVEGLCAMYQEIGPAVASCAAVMPPNNAFALDGFLSMLVGMKVPYRQPFTPSDEERARWQQAQRDFANAARRGLSVPQCLASLRRQTQGVC